MKPFYILLIYLQIWNAYLYQSYNWEPYETRMVVDGLFELNRKILPSLKIITEEFNYGMKKPTVMKTRVKRILMMAQAFAQVRKFVEFIIF